MGLAISLTNSMAQTLGILGLQVYQSKYGPTYHVSYAVSIGLLSAATLGIILTWYLVRRQGLMDSEGAELLNDSNCIENRESISFDLCHNSPTRSSELHVSP